MSVYLGDFALASTVHFFWATNGQDGSSITRGTNGTVSVYKGVSDTQSTSGITDTEDADSTTGLHRATIDLSSDGTFYSTGQNFCVVLSGAVIDGKTINTPLAHFSIENRSPLRPTVAGRTLDVSTTGEGGVDWANVGSPTTTLNLSGTTVKTATDIATATTNIQSDTDDIQTRLPAALVSGRMSSDAVAISGSTTTADNVELAFASTLAEASAVPAANASLWAKINYVFILARNKITQTATTQIVKADDGTTTVATSTVSDDGTTFTRGEFA